MDLLTRTEPGRGSPGGGPCTRNQCSAHRCYRCSPGCGRGYVNRALESLSDYLVG